MAAPHALVLMDPVADDEHTLEELREECRRLRQAQRISGVGSWHFRHGLGDLTVSDSLLELYGLSRQVFEHRPELLKASVHSDDRAGFDAATTQLRLHGTALNLRHRVIRLADGALRWFDSRGVAELDASGAVVAVSGTVADVTDLVETERESQRAHAELTRAHGYQQAVISATPDAIHVYDVVDRTLRRANETGKPLIGFTLDTIRVLSGHDLAELVPAEDLAELERGYTAARLLPDGEVIKLRHRVLAADGQVRWVSRRLTPLSRTPFGAVSLVLVVSRDVTDVVELEQQLEYAALHDELTGLPNRRLVRDRLEHALLRSGRGGRVAVMILDLDGFKRINDSHGHHIGDDVLVQVTRRLQDATRAGDTVARMGGDEFALVLDIRDDPQPAELAEMIAYRIADAVAEPISSGGMEHAVTASIGIRLAEPGVVAESLLADADAAMYFVKAHGGNSHAFFQPSQRPDTAGRDLIERQIRRAIAEDAVEVFYQPVVDPRTNALQGVEALLRLRGEDGRFLNTALVIDVAERTGLIAALDAKVLQLACAQAAGWRQLPGLEQLMLKLNRSVKDITRPGFYGRITDELERSGLAPHALTLEITETVLLDATESNLADLRLLNGLGIGLAIDDFGTGYASLRYLAELPITCIKIDRSFTNRLPSDPTSMTLVRATIGLAEQLGINCVVEGVETTEQLLSLPDYSRLLIQGYLYAKPESPERPPAARIAPGS